MQFMSPGTAGWLPRDSGCPMAVMEIYSAQLETCLLTPVYDRLVPLKAKICSWLYTLWEPRTPLEVSHTSGAVADTLPPYRITIAASKTVPPFLVQACQSWHWSPDLVLLCPPSLVPLMIGSIGRPSPLA